MRIKTKHSLVMAACENGEVQQDKRLGACEVCAVNAAKYTCPRCEVKTCCVECVNIHKKELECSGERNKILYKPLSKFSNLDLLSDYRLLEDVTRSVGSIQQNTKKRHIFSSHLLPSYLIALRRAATRRGMRLHFLPRTFSKARQNTTRLDFATNLINWRLEWVFPQAEGICLDSKKVSECKTLAEALSPYMDPDMCEDEGQKEKMQFYYSAGMSGVVALLRVGEMERYRYHVLDLHSSIRSNLVHKSIIEFPSILIVLRDHKYAYEIYDSDEEEEDWIKTIKVEETDEKHLGSNQQRNVVQVKHKTKRDSNREKNFLIGSGFSDDSSDDDIQEMI